MLQEAGGIKATSLSAQVKACQDTGGGTQSKTYMDVFIVHYLPRVSGPAICFKLGKLATNQPEKDHHEEKRKDKKHKQWNAVQHNLDNL